MIYPLNYTNIKIAIKRKFLSRIIYILIILIFPIILSIFTKNEIVSYTVTFFLLIFFVFINYFVLGLKNNQSSINKNHEVNEDRDDRLKHLAREVSFLKISLRRLKRNYSTSIPAESTQVSTKGRRVQGKGRSTKNR